MKRVLLFLTLGLSFLLTKNGHAQSKTIPGSFSIIENNQPDKLNFYTKSIEAANLEQFRLKDERVQLTFDNGFVVELLSAKEVFIKLGQIEVNSYNAVKTQSDNVTTSFSVRPDGWITVGYGKLQKGRNQ